MYKTFCLFILLVGLLGSSCNSTKTIRTIYNDDISSHIIDLDDTGLQTSNYVYEEVCQWPCTMEEDILTKKAGLLTDKNYITKVNGKYGIIYKGKELLPPYYDDIKGFFSQIKIRGELDLFLASKDGKHFLYHDDTFICETVSKDIYSPRVENNGTANHLGKTYDLRTVTATLINNDGTSLLANEVEYAVVNGQVFGPFDYVKLNSKTKTIVYRERDEKYSRVTDLDFIHKGQLPFDNIGPTHVDGVFIVHHSFARKSLWTLDGNELLPPDNYIIDSNQDYLSFAQDDKSGYISKNHRVVVLSQPSDDVVHITNVLGSGRFLARITSGTTYYFGIIGLEGEVIVPFDVMSNRPHVFKKEIDGTMKEVVRLDRGEKIYYYMLSTGELISSHAKKNSIF